VCDCVYARARAFFPRATLISMCTAAEQRCKTSGALIISVSCTVRPCILTTAAALHTPLNIHIRLSRRKMNEGARDFFARYVTKAAEFLVGDPLARVECHPPSLALWLCALSKGYTL
jgi:hypothetical protein